MKKSIDLSMGIGLSVFMFLVWCFKMIISSDIPVVISVENFKVISITLIVILVAYMSYIIKTKYILTNMILLILQLPIYFVGMKSSLKYNYHKYDTLLNILVFICALIPISQLIYINFKNKLAHSSK